MTASAAPPAPPHLRPKAQLHQLVKQKWKGTLEWDCDETRSTKTDAEGVVVEEVTFKVTLTVSGAITQNSASIPTKSFTAESTGQKRDAEHAAAAAALAWFAEQGYYQPDKPKSSENLTTRADKFRVKDDRLDEANPLVYMDVAVGHHPPARLVAELYQSLTPLAAENFRLLCEGCGGAGKGGEGGAPRSYRGSRFRRAVRRVAVYGGDITAGDGTGGVSASGTDFADEAPGLKALKFDRPFRLATVNRGAPNTNNSQFLISTTPATELQGRHVIFGQVVAGFGVVRQMEHSPVDPSRKLLEECVITDCGVLPPDFQLERAQLSVLMDGPWPCWPEDLQPLPEGPGAEREVDYRLRAATEIKGDGNLAFKEARYGRALELYDQALRYLNWITFRSLDDVVYEDQVALHRAELALMLNRAAALLQLPGRVRDAVRQCREVLSRDPGNAKALYRLGSAYLAARELHNAREAFLEAAQAAPQDKQVRAALVRCRELLEQRRQKERRALGRHFTSGGLTAGGPGDGGGGGGGRGGGGDAAAHKAAVPPEQAQALMALEAQLLLRRWPRSMAPMGAATPDRWLRDAQAATMQPDASEAAAAGGDATQGAAAGEVQAGQAMGGWGAENAAAADAPPVAAPAQGPEGAAGAPPNGGGGVQWRSAGRPHGSRSNGQQGSEASSGWAPSWGDDQGEPVAPLTGLPLSVLRERLQGWMAFGDGGEQE